MEEKKVKFLDKLEEEAVELLGSFKEHPVKSTFTAIIILWGIQKVKELLRGV